MRKQHTIHALLLILLLPFMAYAQKDLRETQSQLVYDTPFNGPQGGQVQSNVDQAKINALLQDLRTARKSGDVNKATELRSKLDDLTGAVKSGPNYNGPQFVGQTLNQQINGSLNDYGFTRLSTDGLWSVATSTDRVTGRIYVAGTAYNSTGSDTLKIFTSADGGASWTLIYKIGYSVAGVHFRADELDIEAIDNGSASYVYIAGGLDYSSTAYSFVARVKSDGTESFYSYLYNTTASVKHTYPRITSDNSNYTSASYIYMVLTQDSLITPTHHLKSKLVRITNPFVATPTLTYGSQNGGGGAFWWNASGVADSTILYNDIAYSDSVTTDVLVLVSNFYRLGFNNLYMAYTKDYGATAPYWTPQITEANVNYKPRIAATGLDSTYLMLCYTRQYNATDWDPYYQRTSNNGTTWTSGYVNGATDTTVYTDVVAIPRVSNTFRIAYSVNHSTTSDFYSRSFNKGTFLNIFQLNPITASYGFTPGRAGYRYAASDSCFNIMEGANGGYLYAFTGCSGTVTGIGNNTSPVTFKLGQNYPNPFNPVTKISYALPKQGFVTLKIYDVLGKEVATLVNESKNAGEYTVDFNASSLSSGVYFYKLESGSFSDIKKMTLIK
ncbi:MAG: T9SS type A sorting domain-containing protein [Bacteroidetes bacterium]|nr:T9SS type A sorting domain-containing protein [Bacteroidota bacterium]